MVPISPPVAAHPDSWFQTSDGRRVELKVHECRWSGDHPANTLAAAEECFKAHVARAEIDISMLQDSDFLVLHDGRLDGVTTGSGLAADTSRALAAGLELCRDGRSLPYRPPLLSQVLEALAEAGPPTLLELDLKDERPWPWPRVEELVRLVQPVKEQITFGGSVDWNMRRLLRVDPTLRMGFTPTDYLDWLPPGYGEESLPGVRGAYGYLDRHQRAAIRADSVADYLGDRMGGLVRLVPGVKELHVRLLCFERMLEDGFSVAELAHSIGAALDVWTLDADTPRWRERLGKAVAGGADVVTTNTPRQMVEAGRTFASTRS